MAYVLNHACYFSVPLSAVLKLKRKTNSEEEAGSGFVVKTETLWKRVRPRERMGCGKDRAASMEI